MHSQGGIGGSSSMDHDTHLAHHDQTFASDQWGDMSPYITTTVGDYGGGAYTFMSPISSHGHGLPSESLGRMPPPATPSQPVLQPHPHPPPPPHHPTLPLLMVPSHPTWPSMLTNPGSFNTSPPVAIPPASSSTSMPSSSSTVKATRPAAQPSQPRKTLTDEDRRRMCQCHLDNPTMKQTEIGAMFGVERSTVSKVLSRKDKWLNPEERPPPPTKKSKSKIPDIDKTLANWLRNEQHKGRRVSDAEIQEQARMYARPFREAETKINNPSWLEKFKQKHEAAGRLIRRASETNIPSAAASKLAMTSPILPSSQPSSAISSGSPAHQQSPSPFSSSIPAKRGAGDNNTLKNHQHQHQHHQQHHHHHLTHHHSFDPETGGSSFSESNLSPTGTGQFTFSPDPNVGGFLASDQVRHFPPGGPDFQRPRSQTFPTLNLEYMNETEPMPSNEPMTPKFPPGGHHHHHQGVSSSGPSSAIDSPAHEFAAAGPFGLDSTMSPHQHHQQPVRPPLHHSSSASSLQGRLSQQQQGGSSTTPVIGSAPLSSVASSPVSPSQEDARRAADTLLSFIANSGPNSIVDQTDYNAVVRLTDKLRIHQQAQQAAATVRGQGNNMSSMGPPAVTGLGMNIGMGGLDRIPEGDAEMSNTGQHVEDEGDFIKSEETMVV
ncbi:hypothetical protein M406DRAFT_336156 [Cryphonectria parasitica EP155]|uniref:HTH CENPB-type domain-containing protein n=1 Tax=Cryphonectria parasitica (strain ATCC 38755 / EP155) TaxID=660469 RepID=A0A9P4YBU4_CRYP1|nr:uncharacterized protein M406DRAFT_336156 [Cryphonectria parasitica EP155]KAF3770491.1 hypothetical protein M406DRAFT_336156 [Cryphonectria parasitica EP155]